MFGFSKNLLACSLLRFTLCLLYSLLKGFAAFIISNGLVENEPLRYRFLTCFLILLRFSRFKTNIFTALFTVLMPSCPCTDNNSWLLPFHRTKVQVHFFNLTISCRVISLGFPLMHLDTWNYAPLLAFYVLECVIFFRIND